MTTTVKYPDIRVALSEVDGNAFSVMGAVRKALKRAGVEQAEVDGFTAEATAGDYDHLLRTCMRWVNVA